MIYQKEKKMTRTTNSIRFLLLILIGLFFICCEDSTSAKKNKTAATIVGKHGQLQIDGAKIIDKNGETVAFHGMSLFWSQWIGKYYNQDCIKWLRDDWKCNIVRAAMAIEHGGYLENPSLEKSRVCNVIDACIDLGIYVIIDWHDHNAHLHTEEAKTFFREMATRYGEYPNIIYEIYNEPEKISWRNEIKPYAEAVIAEIRAVDQDNIIVVGTPTWSQDVDIATADPIDDANVAYTAHFYAATHKQYLRDKITTAMQRGYAVFVTEFGVCLHTGDGDIDYQSAEEWFQYMDTHNISWCKWSIADKNEGDAALLEGANAKGGWTAQDLRESGQYIRSEIITRNQSAFDALK
jgi:endoglucanase